MDSWRRHLTVLLGTFAGLVAVSALLVAVANPYGNLGFSPMRHVLMDDNQRFQYPAVIRSGRYDSLVVGTSTGRLLEPAQLEAKFGGRFANLALNSGTAWEQMRLVRLFRDTVKTPRVLVMALDHVWCAADADTKRITPRGFPEWMFDANPWNDLLYMLNARTVEIAGRRIGHALGLARERWPHNGYEVFVPPESKYDLAKARHNIHGGTAAATSAASTPETVPPASLAPDAAASSMSFPALAWLDALVQPANGWSRIILLTTPIHRAGMPQPGTQGHRREVACKNAIGAIAKRHGVPFVDFRIISGITSNDANYWDALHYRVPIASRIVEGLHRALATGKSDPDGDWRVLAAPGRS